LGDKYGRKTALVVSNVLCILSGYLSSYSDSATTYIVIRIAIGIFLGMLSVLTIIYLDEMAFKNWR